MHLSPPTDAARADEAQELAQACGALWLATLSLMTAYMHQPAPAHRHLLARRIARNLDTLKAQPCYADDCRARFARLAGRWEKNAERAMSEPAVQPRGLRAFLFGMR